MKKRITPGQLSCKVQPILEKLADPRRILTKQDRSVIVGYINLLESKIPPATIVERLKFWFKFGRHIE